MSGAPAGLGTTLAAAPAAAVPASRLGRREAALVFLAFAAAYFCSTMVRAITATLSPVLTQEFSLHARDLGLLAGGYFLGFAAMQLPLGRWLDRHGPKNVILCFLGVAVAGCLAFSLATSFAGLLAARVLVGMGVSACLMAPLTGYRRWLDLGLQLRANSWMLMSGSLGMLASTLPVQWLLPQFGWRPLFWMLAGLVVLAMAAIAWVAPRWHEAPAAPSGNEALAAPAGAPAAGGYAEVWANPYFRRLAPLAFVNYGGMVAIQTLWAGPWLVKVAGYTPLESATGLFCINASMLVTYWGWGMLNPALARRGWSVDRLLGWGVPLGMLMLAGIIALGSGAGWVGWALFCVACSVLPLMQPAVALAFPAGLAGRALSASNLMVFAGVFVMQWGIGLALDLFRAAGLGEVASFRAAMGVFLCGSIAAYGHFVYARPHNRSQ